MGFSLRPVESSFYRLFAASAQHLVDGAELLVEMLADDADRPDIAGRMRDAEHAADETTHAIVRQLNATFVTPLDREDIYALASALDDVMDEMDEAADLILIYQLDRVPAEFSDQVAVLQRCAEITAAAMPSLRSMGDLGDYWVEVNRLENAGDRTHRAVLARLFGDGYKALEVMKLKDVAEALEGAIDAFEKVANITEQIAVKEG